jgi:hypothetical protein
MTEDEIQLHLKLLGQATRPPDSLAGNVMQRIQQSPAYGDSALFRPKRINRWTYIMAVSGIAACLIIATFAMRFRNPRGHCRLKLRS